jgi:hypothetical protein
LSVAEPGGGAVGGADLKSHGLEVTGPRRAKRRSPGATTREVSMCDGAASAISAQKVVFPLVEIKPPLLACVEAVRVLEQLLGPLVQR